MLVESLIMDRIIQDRKKQAVQLAEEIGLRTEKLKPVMERMQQINDRMQDIEKTLYELTDDGSNKDERANLRRELKDLMLLSLETPKGIRNRCERIQTSFNAFEGIR